MKDVEVNPVADYEIDKLDRQILAILLQDARLPYTEIAKQLIVSAGTIHVRMRKMEEAGIVEGSSLQVNAEKLGFDLTAFLGINLERGSHYHEVVKKLSSIPEVVEAHYTTGHYGIFAKIVCRNTRHMRYVLNDVIQAIPGISSTETFISLEESLHRPIPVSQAMVENES